MMMTLSPPLNSPRDKIKLFLRTLNVVAPFVDKVPLSDGEIAVLTELLLLPRDRYRYYRFSSKGKRKAAESYSEYYGKTITPNAINACVYAMHRKGYIIRDKDRTLLLPDLIENAVAKIIDQPDASLTLNISIS